MEDANWLRDKIADNWSLTDISPVIDVVYRYKDIDVRRKDWVLLYERGGGVRDFGLGGKYILRENGVSIDIRTSDVDKYYKIKKEVERILISLTNSKDTVNGVWNVICVLKVRETDLSDRSKGLYRCVIDVSVRSWR